jgi:hypothetical protein
MTEHPDAAMCQQPRLFRAHNWHKRRYRDQTWACPRCGRTWRTFRRGHRLHWTRWS